jgi:translocation and assembly module TamB
MANPKRIRRWILVLFSAFVVLVFAGTMILNSRALHQYLLSVIIERAQKTIGGHVEIRDIALHLSTLRIDFYRVAIHGTETNPHAPLLAVDHLALGFGVGSAHGQKIMLNEIVIDRPVLHLSFNAQGQMNMPETPQAGSKPVNIFDLAIGHVLVNNGEIHYNDRSLPLAADIQDLQAKVAFNASRSGYDSFLSYRRATMQFGGFNPFEHTLQARLTAAPSGLTLDSLVLKSGSSWFEAQGSMKDYANPSVEVSYQAALFSGELATLVKETSLPSGELDTKGAVTYRTNPSRPLIDNLSIIGTFNSPALTLTSPQAQANVRDLKGEYRLDDGTLEVRNLQGDVMGGHLAGQLRMAHLAENPDAQVKASIRDLSLPALRAALRPKPLPGIGIAGRFSCNLQGSWQGSLQNLQLRSDATIAGSVAETPPAPGGRANVVPLDATLHLAYDGRSQGLALHNTSLHTPQSSLNLEGDLGDRTKLGIRARSADLHELDLLALTFQSSTSPHGATPSETPQLLGLAGSASFDATVSGPMRNPQVAGQLEAANLQYHSASLRAVRAGIQLSSSGLALHRGEVQSSAQGQVDFDITVGLENWSFTPQEPISIRIAADKLALADIQRIAGLQYPISGVLSANVTASGSEVNPVGEGYVRVTQASAWDEQIQDLTVRFQGSESDIHTTVDLRTPAGSANATLAYRPKEQGYDLHFDFPGIRLEQVEPLHARNPQIAGLIVASANGQGTLKAPQVEANIEAPQLRAGQQKLDGLKAHMSVAQQLAAFSLDYSISGASLTARGEVNLTGDYEATANIESQTIELDRLVASFLPQSGADLHGQTQLRASLRGPLKDPNRLEAHVEIPTLNFAYQSLQIAAAAPIRLDYHDGVASLRHSELKGTGTDLQLEANVPIQKPGSLQAKATGSVDLQLIQLFNPHVRSSGQINLNIGAQGSSTQPEIHGTVRVAGAALVMPNAPGIEKVNGEFEIAGGRINVKSFAGQVGGGEFSMRGFAAYQPAVQFNIRLTAKTVRLLYPGGTRTLLSGDLSFSGTTDAALLNGQVTIDRLALTNSFDLANFADQFSGPSSPPSGLAENVKLNITVTTREELALASSQLSIQGSADLHVQGTAAEPVIVGRTNIERGEMFFEGRRYQVQNAVIQFVNPVQTEPVVNLSVTTVVEQFNLSLNFVGPLDHLRTTYTSDPSLPPVDIINLLVTGHTTEAAKTSPTTPQSVVASQVSGQVSSRVQKLTGISSLTIDPQIGGNQGNAASQLAIQQRVTKNLFFTFATDVTTTQGEVVQVEYQVTRRFSMSAVRDQTGGYKVEIKARKVF